jgi:hypothetical protein
VATMTFQYGGYLKILNNLNVAAGNKNTELIADY